MSRFEGKNYWALILGASSGIGLATAKKLAYAGMNLLLVYRERRSRQEEVRQEYEELKSNGIQIIDFNADATNADKIEALIADIAAQIGNGKIRLLLHSIAKGNLKVMTSPPPHEKIDYPAQTLIPSDFVLTSESMAYSIVPWLNGLVDKELLAERSRVIALTSAGDKRVWKGYAAVASAKAAMEAIIKYVAVEYAHLGVTSNLIEAGVTVTPSMQMIPGSAQIIEKVKDVHPMRRMTTPEDIANTVFLLAQDEADWINGARLVADGGESLI